jgi:hypothetical protein
VSPLSHEFASRQNVENLEASSVGFDGNAEEWKEERRSLLCPKLGDVHPEIANQMRLEEICGKFCWTMFLFGGQFFFRQAKVEEFPLEHRTFICKLLCWTLSEGYSLNPELG